MFEHKKILIVDDEESARLYLAEIIQELYSEVELNLASTPNEALFILKSNKIDCVLLDVEMPGMTGLELIEKVRTFAGTIPIIFVSGYKRAEFIQKAMRFDAVDYLDKPVNPNELNAALLRAFNTTVQAVDVGLKNKDRFCIMTAVGEMFIDINELIYFETMKRYSIAYFSDGTNKLIRHNLESLEKILPESTFLRVSRQYIVNLSTIKFVSKNNKTITLKGFEKLVELNRVYPKVICELIEKHKI